MIGLAIFCLRLIVVSSLIFRKGFASSICSVLRLSSMDFTTVLATGLSMDGCMNERKKAKW